MGHTSGICSQCERGISRHSLMEHLESCLSEKGWEEVEDPSIVIHINPKMDNRYYLVLIIRPDSTFYTLDTFLKSSVGEDEDLSSRFQFKDQMYFSHMNDGYPGMNCPLGSSPIMHERFTYLIYSHRWFPVIIEGMIMGKVLRASPDNKAIATVAYNKIPEKFHKWPQQPKK